MDSSSADITYRPARSGVLKVLSDVEGSVMETLWRMGSGTVREVHASLGRKRRELAYTAVMTVMTRLFEKRLLERAPEGNAFRYRPAMPREVFIARASRAVFSGLMSDLNGSVLTAFVDGLGTAEARALEELARLIEAKRRGVRAHR